jgi:hypothetical protein
MSALDQKQTSERDRSMSALCQKQTLRDAAKRCLFDHLVGSSEDRLWDDEAECFGGLEI